MNLSRNFYRIWFVLLIISAAVFLWFSGIAIGGAWKFFRLNSKASAKILNWNVREISSSRFALEAEYQFEFDGSTYFGKTVFENPQFLNQFAAENYMQINGSKSWEAWFQSNHPNFSSLERDFPQKKCLQALLTLGVFLYFLFARSMVLRLHQQASSK